MQLPSPHGRRAFLAGLTGLGMTLLLPNAWGRGRVTAEPVRLAGRLGMLAQRMGKAYCQIGLGVAVETSTKILAASRSAFSEHLAALPSLATEDLARLKEIWSRSEPLLHSPPSAALAHEVLALGDEMSGLAEKISTQLQRQFDTPGSRAVALSSRLGILSQRLPLFYLRRQWGIAAKSVEQDSDAARDQMAAGLIALARSRQTTREIAAELKLARLRWLLLDQALNQQDFTGNNGLAYTREVADESEALLAVLDRIAFLHVGQARRASSAS